MRQRIELSSNLCAGVFDPQYTIMHNLGMDQPAAQTYVHDVRELLVKMGERVPGKQKGLADFIGASQTNISRWKKGQVPELPNYRLIVEAAERLGIIGDIRSEDVAAALDKPSRRGVRIVGYVGAGAKGHFYAVAHDDYTVVDPPPGITDKTVAVEIKGKSFGPLLDSWLVYYDDVRSPVEPDLYGEVCVIGLSDDRVVIKKIVSNGRGGFTLESNSGEEPIENAEIEWAAKVIDMRPR